MFWDRLFARRQPAVSASDAGRALADRAARKRAADAVPIAERRARIVAELRRSGAVSPLPPREEVVAPVRAAWALRKEEKNG
jgi:hypothetical protein